MVITERKILSLKQRASRYYGERHFEQDNKEYRITSKQTKKGLKWLYDKVFKPSHLKKVLETKYWQDNDIRKNSGVDSYEIDILLNFDYFLFLDLTVKNIWNHNFYFSAYRVVDKEGNFFDYHNEGGKIIID